MKISEQGIALIKECEGFSATPYICPAGKRTIGYGHVILDCERFAEKISESEGERLLYKDLEFSELTIKKNVLFPLKQGQFDALCSFVYNVGAQAFVKSTLLRLLNAGDAESAAMELGRWIYAGGRKMPGLTARRAKETALFSQKP